MARKNDGKDAQHAFFEAMRKRPGVVVERFWDQSDLRGRNGGRAVADFPKPADFLVTQNAQIEYAEVKSVQSATSFPFSNIERSQRSAALRQAMVGGAYNFYIFSYGLGRWFRMSAKQFADIIAAGKASAKFTELEPWVL